MKEPDNDANGGGRMVIDRPVASLRPYENNPRTHTKKQVRQLADSIGTFGWTNPVLVDADGRIIAGHGRVEAAKLLGMTTVPTLLIDGMSETQKRAYVIADNRLAELAGWDGQLLKLELGALIDLDLDFEIQTIGFEMGDIDRLLGIEPVSEEEPVAEPDRSEEAVSRRGDLWIIGPHRIFCGDAREASSYEALLQGEKASMVFTDAPYNVPVNGHVSGLGSVRHEEFAMASGEMSGPEFTQFLRTVFGRTRDASTEGSIHYHCMDWRHMREMLTAGEGVYEELKNLCVWGKTNAGMGSFYRSQHELVFVFKSGKGPHINNFGLGDKGRHRSNLWTYAGANTFRKGRMEDLTAHPTVKPVAMVVDAILDCSNRGDVVLDPFLGSGTTLLAAQKTGRRGAGIEIDPRYVDLAIRRLETESGHKAVHSSGLSFEELKLERAGEEAWLR